MPEYGGGDVARGLSGRQLMLHDDYGDHDYYS